MATEAPEKIPSAEAPLPGATPLPGANPSQGANPTLADLQCQLNDCLDRLQTLEGLEQMLLLLHQSLQIWAESEPHNMWEETRKFLADNQEAVEETRKAWSQEERRLWLNDLIAQGTQEMIEITRQYRDTVFTRANRAITVLAEDSKNTIDRIEELITRKMENMELQMRGLIQTEIQKITLANQKSMDKLIRDVLGQLDGQG
ncbi:hypothetical protein [Acidithiobacillus thiooxidans]|uniref:hypothetical protein n=1 Tax=Acidithiobacillus thiooxidans TaxID=930 RepID=UPI003564F1FE|nr:hypothetical protein [Acidithiobacillus sp.]